MSASCLAPTAFLPGYIHSLPTIQELLKNVHTCKKPKGEKDVEDEEEIDDFILVDPPETSSITVPVAEMSSMSIDEPPRTSPFVDMLVREAKETAALGRTENNAAIYTASLYPLVDLFYAVKEETDSESIEKYLTSAWEVDPLKALKLLFYLRDVRDGKGCNEEFYDAAHWLFESHPETFKYNVVRFCPRFGYWKDLLEILVQEHLGKDRLEKKRSEDIENRNIFSPNMRAQRIKAAKTRHALSKSSRSRRSHYISPPWRKPATKLSAVQERKARSKARREGYAKMTPEEVAKAKAVFAMEVEEKQQELKKKIKQDRLDKRDSAIAQCRSTWSTRQNWRDLHIAIAKQFAVTLYIDKQRLDAKKHVSSLCAKWAPTPGHYHDKYACIAATIALILFPSAMHRRENESEDKYISRALKMYQAQYLSPLREAAHIAETLMSVGKWNSINYSHVPSISFKRNQKNFRAHDTDRFTQHVSDAAAGKGGKKIQASTLKPHEIVRKLMTGYYWNESSLQPTDELEGQVVEAQWLNYVENIQKVGSLDNCIAIADVSGSMSGLPMECSIALSLLVATVSKPPFSKAFITFSEEPQFVVLPESAKTLRDKIKFVQRLPWGMNTNFQAVFDMLLQIAKKNHLANADMIKTIFVFSDMQFDEACHESSKKFETDYQMIQRKFAKARYDTPKIVFWNLRESVASSTAVLYNTAGTAMISGWSGQMLKMFMENGGEMINRPELTPEFVMDKAIGKPSYDVLKIID